MIARLIGRRFSSQANKSEIDFQEPGNVDLKLLFFFCLNKLNKVFK